MKNKKKSIKKEDDIKVVVMNPECIPIAQKRSFDFFYQRYISQTVKESFKETENK